MRTASRFAIFNIIKMEMHNLYNPIRDILRTEFSFPEIKDIFSSAGLPIYKIGNIQQKYTGGNTKGQLMDEIDNLYNPLSKIEKEEITKNIIVSICNKKPNLVEKVSEILEKFGWSLTLEHEPFPIQLQINLEFSNLPENIKKGINICMKRYRDGDINGSISVICATIDSLTEKFYIEKNLGDHKSSSCQERVSKTFNSFEIRYKELLQTNGISDNSEITKIWDNYKKSISNAGYVLGGFRREFSDVHGNFNKVDTILVQNTIDIAVYLIRNVLIMNEL